MGPVYAQYAQCWGFITPDIFSPYLQKGRRLKSRGQPEGWAHGVQWALFFPLQLLGPSHGVAMSAPGWFATRKRNTFYYMLKTTTLTLTPRLFFRVRRGILDSPESRFPAVLRRNSKWAGSSGPSPGYKALLPTSSLPTPTIPMHSSVMTSHPRALALQMTSVASPGPVQPLLALPSSLP